MFLALQQALVLLFTAAVQVELEQDGAVVPEHALEGVDVIVAGAKGALRHEVEDARCQHVLVVGAIEQRDVSSPWGHLVHTPEEVVGPLLLCRRLERLHACVLDVGELEKWREGAIDDQVMDYRVPSRHRPRFKARFSLENPFVARNDALDYPYAT